MNRWCGRFVLAVALPVALAFLLTCPAAVTAEETVIAGVVNDADGKPIVGAVVSHAVSGRQRIESTTDDMGRFRLTGPQARRGAYGLVVRAKGFAADSVSVAADSQEALGRVVVRLAKGHSIRGRVVNSAGEPLEKVWIAATDGTVGDPGGATTLTDAEGRFALDSLRERSRFLFQAAGYPMIDRVLLDLDGDKEVTVVLEAGVELRGHVVDDETGKAIETFRVRANFARRLRGETANLNATLPQGLSDGQEFRSPTGEFVITELTKGLPLEIFIEASGYERLVLPRVITGAEDKSLSRIPLKKRDSKPASFAGKLADEHGKPLAGVQLRLIVTSAPLKEGIGGFTWSMVEHDGMARSREIDQYLRAVSDAEGKFEFKDILPGKSLQLAYWGGGAPRGRWSAPAPTVAGEGKSAVIKVPQAAVVRGSFDAAEFPQGRGITFELDDSVLVLFLQLKEGTTEFQFGDLPSGSVRIFLTGPREPVPDRSGAFKSESLAMRKLVIEAGKTYDVKFTKDDLFKPRGR